MNAFAVDRAQSYDPDRRLDLTRLDTWTARHRRLSSQRWCSTPQPTSGMPSFNRTRSTRSAVPKLLNDLGSATTAQLDANLDLLRVDRASFIARAERRPRGRPDCADFCDRRRLSDGGRPQMDWCASLARWARTRDLRRRSRVAARTWRIFSVRPHSPQWPDVLRDRFRLAHLDPALVRRPPDDRARSRTFVARSDFGAKSSSRFRRLAAVHDRHEALCQRLDRELSRPCCSRRGRWLRRAPSI